MTSENQLLFSPKDILAVRIICKKCGAIISFPATNWKSLPYACGNCGEQLMQNLTSEEKTLQMLSRILEQIVQIENDRFAIEFELRNC